MTKTEKNRLRKQRANAKRKAALDKRNDGEQREAA